MKKEKINLTFIASRIRAVREALNLTQKQLAQRLNISGPTKRRGQVIYFLSG